MSNNENGSFKPEQSGLDKNSHLFSMLGNMALLLEEQNTAETELQTVEQGLDADLRVVQEKWKEHLKNAEQKAKSATSAISAIRYAIQEQVTEGYYNGTASEEDVIYTSGLMFGPNDDQSWNIGQKNMLHFESARQDLELYRSLQIGEPVIYDDLDHSNNRRILISGILSENPFFRFVKIEEGVYYDPLNPEITLKFNNADSVTQKWFGLKKHLVVGEENINDFIENWAKKNFVPKNSPADSWKTFKKLNELAGLYSLGYSNEKIHTIKNRLLSKVNKELFMDDYWTDDLPQKLTDILKVGGQEKFDEVAYLVGQKMSMDQLTDIFAEMLNSNLEKEPLTVQYATKLKAAEMAEIFHN